LFALIVLCCNLVLTQNDDDRVKHVQEDLVTRARNSGLFQKPNFKMAEFNQLLEQAAQDAKNEPVQAVEDLDAESFANTDPSGTSFNAANTSTGLPVWGVALLVTGALVVFSLMVILVQLVMLVRRK